MKSTISRWLRGSATSVTVRYAVSGSRPSSVAVLSLLL